MKWRAVVFPLFLLVFLLPNGDGYFNYSMPCNVALNTLGLKGRLLIASSNSFPAGCKGEAPFTSNSGVDLFCTFFRDQVHAVHIT